MSTKHNLYPNIVAFYSLPKEVQKRTVELYGHPYGTPKKGRPKGDRTQKEKGAGSKQPSLACTRHILLSASTVQVGTLPLSPLEAPAMIFENGRLTANTQCRECIVEHLRGLIEQTKQARAVHGVRVSRSQENRWMRDALAAHGY